MALKTAWLKCSVNRASRWWFLNPLEWLKTLYEIFGAKHPMPSLVCVMILGALIAGVMWHIGAQQYEKSKVTIAGGSETATIRARVVTMIRELKTFQLERTQIEISAERVLRSEAETGKLFTQQFSDPLHKLAMDLPQSLAREGRLIKDFTESSAGGGAESLDPLLATLQSVSASL
jgi:hypothetical protein